MPTRWMVACVENARQLIANGFSVDGVERLKNDAVEELVLKFIDEKFAHIANRSV